LKFDAPPPPGGRWWRLRTGPSCASVNANKRQPSHRQSASAARFIAGEVGFFTFTQCGQRPPQKARSRCLLTIPSSPMRQAARNRSGPMRYLALTLWKEGREYASIEARSMIFGSIALAAYCFVVCQLLMRLLLHALASTTLAFVV
jgi:hypothetical protein